MKRPYSTTLLLLSSSVVVVQSQDTNLPVDPRKKVEVYDTEPCYTLLSHAAKYDVDDSGGLSKLEFAQYFNSLDGSFQDFSTSSLTNEDGETENSMVHLYDTAALYSELKCGCVEFGNDENCCDDTATDDEVEPAQAQEIDPETGEVIGKMKVTKNSEDNMIWKEVSLMGISSVGSAKLGEIKPSKDEKNYMEKFCDGVELSLETNDIELGIDEDEPATTTTVATEPAIVEEAANETVVDAVDESVVDNTDTETAANTTTYKANLGAYGEVKMIVDNASGDFNMDIELQGLDADFFGEAPPSTLNFHLHSGRVPDDAVGALGDGNADICGSDNTLGHYDPTVACGPASTAKSDPGCDPAGYPVDGEYEIGDLSGIHGSIAIDNGNGIKEIEGGSCPECVAHFLENTNENPTYNTWGSIVIHNGSPRVLCASFVKEESDFTETTGDEATVEENQEEELPEVVEPEVQTITLSFIGSTGGAVNAASINLEDVTHAMWDLSLNVMEDLIVTEVGKRGRRRLSAVVGDVARMNIKVVGKIGITREERQLEGWDFGEEAAVYFESVTMNVDDVDCPSGLDYATESAPCLEFKYTLTPLADGPITFDLANEFATEFQIAVNNGELYDTLIREYPDTDIVGLGSPGKGKPLEDEQANPFANANQLEKVQLEGQEQNDSAAAATSGLSAGGIAGIAIAIALIGLVIGAFILKKQHTSKQELNDSNLSDSNLSEDVEAAEMQHDAEWFDEEDANGEGRNRTRDGMKTTGSSLAALGVASTVATRLSTGDTEVMMMKKQSWARDEPVV